MREKLQLAWMVLRGQAYATPFGWYFELTTEEARDMARGLCNAAQRVDDKATESEHTAA